jgi:hypothetical protein
LTLLVGAAGGYPGCAIAPSVVFNFWIPDPPLAAMFDEP